MSLESTSHMKKTSMTFVNRVRRFPCVPAYRHSTWNSTKAVFLTSYIYGNAWSQNSSFYFLQNKFCTGSFGWKIYYRLINGSSCQTAILWRGDKKATRAVQSAFDTLEFCCFDSFSAYFCPSEYNNKGLRYSSWFSLKYMTFSCSNGSLPTSAWRCKATESVDVVWVLLLAIRIEKTRIFPIIKTYIKAAQLILERM